MRSQEWVSYYQWSILHYLAANVSLLKHTIAFFFFYSASPYWCLGLEQFDNCSGINQYLSLSLWEGQRREGSTRQKKGTAGKAWGIPHKWKHEEKEQDNPDISLRCTCQAEGQRNMFWPNPKVNKNPFLLPILLYFLVEEEKEEIRNLLYFFAV